MSATTSQPPAGMSVPAEPGPGRGRQRRSGRVLAGAVTGQITRWLAAAVAARRGHGAAPARKRFRNRRRRTTGAQARSAAPAREHDLYDNDACGSGHRGRRRARLRRAGLLAAALALIGLLATACGGGPPRAKGAAGGVDAALAYARCMRAHGVPDFPDPSSDGQFNVDPHSVSSQETAANQACHHLLTAGRQANAAQQQHMLGQLVKYARCMRAHGVPNFPDPQTTSGGIGEHPGMGFDTPGIDPNNPQVRAANQACQHLANSAKG